MLYMCSVCVSRAAGAALQGGAGKASKQRVTVGDACAVREQGGCAPTRLQIAEVSILRGGARHVRHARAATQREFFQKIYLKKHVCLTLPQCGTPALQHGGIFLFLACAM